MNAQNKVYIATSLDGYIADAQGGVAWLDTFALPKDDDMGWGKFMAGIDALLMGRNTFETVVGFDVEWPYSKPVFVLSNSLTEVPEKYLDKVEIVSGSIQQVLDELHGRNFLRLYIDGGNLIQSFLREDLIDELIITTIPVVLGGGIPLFGSLETPLNFKCVESKVYGDAVVQNRFVRAR